MAKKNKFEQKIGNYTAFLDEFRSADGVGVTIGIHSEDDEVTQDGASLVEIAIYNEFGTEHIPERSFLRAGIEEEKDALGAFIAGRLESAFAGKLEMDIALAQIGIKGQGIVRKKITSLKEPANTAATIAKKGSSNPLIDTGLLRQSITWQKVSK